MFESTDIIHAYTRQQAIEDGMLVDVSGVAAEAGFRYPVAVTRSVWVDCIEWSTDDSTRQVPQDENGRLWDVLSMAALAARNQRTLSSELTFTLYRVPRGGYYRKPSSVELKLVIGPGDSGEPVMTIMQPEES